MATNTSHYNLVKPAYTDTADIADINGNMDIIDTAMYGMKTKQTAKTDPTASGTTKDFIATITQNANGEVTATKKTVATMTGATSSANGATGLVPQPLKADAAKYLKGDGSWDTPTDHVYTEATSSAYGLVKIGFSESGTNYAVKLSSGKAYVTVPAGTDTKNTAGATDTSSKIYLIGATSQSANPQTYSQDTAYVGMDGHLYSNGKKVLNAGTAVTIAQGGTGATTAATARSNLGVKKAGTYDVLPIDFGGTGAQSASNARTNLGLGDAATQAVANNLTTSASGSVLDARQGKALNDALKEKININGNDLNNAILIIKTGIYESLPHNSTKTVSFSTAFPNGCTAVWAWNAAESFGAAQTICVQPVDKTKFKLYQWNTAGSSSYIKWMAIGN